MHARCSLIDRGNANGLTALHYAVWHKRHRTVATLCELGASLYAASTWSTLGDLVGAFLSRLNVFRGVVMNQK